MTENGRMVTDGLRWICTQYDLIGGRLKVMSGQETLFERLARINKISVEEMRTKIAARIEAGLNDPSPERRAQWERIPCAGDIPTPEEWLRYSVERLKEDGREDLLRRYLVD